MKKAKKKVHEMQRTLVLILMGVLAAARTDGAVIDGHVPSGEIRPKDWIDWQKERAEAAATEILRRVVHRVLEPYEKAVLAYGNHLCSCDYWQGDGKECSCGLDGMVRVIESHQVLQPEKGKA